MEEIRTRQKEREYLQKSIAEWNASHLEIFEISEPNEDLEYSGGVPFFFQDARKKMCADLRYIGSVETAEDVTKTLVEQFRSDMTMLFNPNYSLYEVHPNGETRKLAKDDKPLVVQLSWQKDKREGRFLLMSDQETPVATNVLPTITSDDSAITQKLYDEIPETSFTQTISNPEIVTEMRRQQKLINQCPEQSLPYLKETSSDGRDLDYKANIYQLPMGITEVGSDKSLASSSSYLELFVPHILPYYCVMTNVDGIVSVEPTSSAEVYVDGRRIYESTKLNHASVIKISGNHTYKFCDPAYDTEEKVNQSSKAPKSDIHVVISSFGVPDVTPEDEMDDKLPARLDYQQSGEDALFAAIISEVNGDKVRFKWAPAYALYMCCRYVFSLPYQRGERLASTVENIANVVQATVKKNSQLPGSLAFWLANSSELRHFLKHDVNISQYLKDSHLEALQQSVQMAFTHLVQCVTQELRQVMSAFFDDTEDADLEDGDIDSTTDPDAIDNITGGDNWLGGRQRCGKPRVSDILYTLSSAQSLLYHCDVDAPLIRKVFSQLFHYMIMWIFNKRVLQPQLGLFTKNLNHRLSRRLEKVETWAEKHGLSLEADCHLCRVVQADTDTSKPVCYKVNSVQLLALLQNYRQSPDECKIPRFPMTHMDILAGQTKNVKIHDKAPSGCYCLGKIFKRKKKASREADELIGDQGQEVTLAEDPQLQLFFLLPEDLWLCSATSVRGVPPGLKEFLNSLAGKCGGMSSISPQSQTPEIMDITFYRGQGSMGLNFTQTRGTGQGEGGIYIKEVGDGPAAKDGRLRAGDQLLAINDESLVSILRIPELMAKSGPDVTLRIARKGASDHGLETLFSQAEAISSETPELMAKSGAEGTLQITREGASGHGLHGLETLLSQAVSSEMPELIPKLERLHAEGTDCNLSFQVTTQNVSDDRLDDLEITINPALVKNLKEQLEAMDRFKVDSVIVLRNRERGGISISSQSQTPEIMDISFYRGQGAIGISQFAAMGAGQDKLGIFIAEVIKDGPAAKDGRLQAGDQLLTLNGESVVGISSLRVTEMISKSGPNITLQIAKQAVSYHGLDSLLAVLPSMTEGELPLEFQSCFIEESVFVLRNRELSLFDISSRTTQTPEIMDISFYIGHGIMGIGSIAAMGAGQDQLGIFIVSLQKDGPAAKDGRLHVGDQVLALNDESLVGVPQQRVPELMAKSGPNVTLQVAKQAASYYGLNGMENFHIT